MRTVPQWCACNRSKGVKRTGGDWICQDCLDKTSKYYEIRERRERAKQAETLQVTDVETFWLERYTGERIQMGDSIKYLDELIKRAQEEPTKLEMS